MKQEKIANSAYAVAVLLVSPKGIPLVRDPKKPEPLYWKLPGGRSIDKETPEKTAIREIKEEIGISIKKKDVWVAYQEEREGHTFCLIQGTIVSLDGLKSEGEEKEEVKLFLPDELKNLSDFFPSHKEILQAIRFF